VDAVLGDRVVGALGPALLIVRAVTVNGANVAVEGSAIT
jgi:hypothetical protein